MMDRFVRKDSRGALSIPIQDEKVFNEYLFRFITEDLEGVQQFRT